VGRVSAVGIGMSASGESGFEDSLYTLYRNERGGRAADAGPVCDGRAIVDAGASLHLPRVQARAERLGVRLAIRSGRDVPFVVDPRSGSLACQDRCAFRWQLRAWLCAESRRSGRRGRRRLA